MNVIDMIIAVVEAALHQDLGEEMIFLVMKKQHPPYRVQEEEDQVVEIRDQVLDLH